MIIIPIKLQNNRYHIIITFLFKANMGIFCESIDISTMKADIFPRKWMATMMRFLPKREFFVTAFYSKGSVVLLPDMCNARLVCAFRHVAMSYTLGLWHFHNTKGFLIYLKKWYFYRMLSNIDIVQRNRYHFYHSGIIITNS